MMKHENVIEHLQRLARSRLSGQPVFQPLELPAPLLRYSPDLLETVARQIRAFGFPYMQGTDMFKVVFLRSNEKLIRVSAGIPPTPTIISVGNVEGPCYYLFLQVGIIMWAKDVSPEDLREASKNLDSQMMERGFIHRENGDRECLLRRPRSYRVRDVFPNEDCEYPMNASWRIAAVKGVFEDSEPITTMTDPDEGVVLLLRSRVEALASGAKRRRPRGLSMSELRDRILEQYHPQRYS